MTEEMKNTPVVEEEELTAVEAKTKKEKVSKKIKKLAARSAQLINYIQAHQEDREVTEVIIEGIFTIFGGFEELPDFTKTVELVAKYQAEPDKAEKILAPLDEEKKAIRKEKREERFQKRVAKYIESQKQ